MLMYESSSHGSLDNRIIRSHAYNLHPHAVGFVKWSAGLSPSFWKCNLHQVGPHPDDTPKKTGTGVPIYSGPIASISDRIVSTPWASGITTRVPHGQHPVITGSPGPRPEWRTAHVPYTDIQISDWCTETSLPKTEQTPNFPAPNLSTTGYGDLESRNAPLSRTMLPGIGPLTFRKKGADERTTSPPLNMGTGGCECECERDAMPRRERQPTSPTPRNSWQ
jgi:hypothetical protein